jgi:hypothetical protein
MATYFVCRPILKTHIRGKPGISEQDRQHKWQSLAKGLGRKNTNRQGAQERSNKSGNDRWAQNIPRQPYMAQITPCGIDRSANRGNFVGT